MSTQENKDFIDLGSDLISDDFDPFASDDELETEITAATPSSQQQEPASPSEPVNPLETAIDKAETKEAEKAQQGLFEKLPVFEYAGATEDISDTSKTFDELRIEKATDFPELDDGKRVSWTVEYGKITKTVPNPKATSIGKIKSEIETSKEFLDSLKKAKDKNPVCKIKPRVTAQSKGIASYKGIFRTLEEAEASDKPIRIIPARDGHVYELRHIEAGRFITRTDNANPPDETIDTDRYVHVADIHSHNSMPAFFSGTDDRDELATRAYIVVGLLHQAFPSIAARISVGGKYVPIDVRQVVDIPKQFNFPDLTDYTDFPTDWLSMVNIAKNTASYSYMNIDVPVHIHSRTSWLNRLRGFRLRKGA